MRKVAAGGHSAKSTDRPSPAGIGFQVRVNGALHGHGFADLRDAMEAAQIVKRERRSAIVGVCTPDGQMIAAID